MFDPHVTQTTQLSLCPADLFHIKFDGNAHLVILVIKIILRI